MIKIGTIIDKRYRIEDLLGEGGMGIVYQAFDIYTKKMVAIKFLKPETAKDSQNVERFEIEARASATLSHPNIVAVLNVGNYEGLPFMINELIKGKTLDSELETRTKFTYLEAIDIMDQLCQAVIATHDAGVIHRDIKPSNIYILPDGTIKLGDFGIATMTTITPKKVDSAEIVGSAQYLAPEICKGEEATVRSDVYALTITLFQLITGRVPFDGQSNIDIAIKQINEPFPSPKKYLSSIPRKLEKLILKGTKKIPKKRFKNVKEMYNQIVYLKENPKYLKPHYSIWVRWFGFATED